LGERELRGELVGRVVSEVRGRRERNLGEVEGTIVSGEDGEGIGEDIYGGSLLWFLVCPHGTLPARPAIHVFIQVQPRPVAQNTLMSLA
jgi:hypothetical protein